MAPLTVDELASLLDHSIIDSHHTEKDFNDGIALSKKYKCGRFTTQPFRVKKAIALLEGTGIEVQTFNGFPHGCDHTEVKVLQAKKALEDGVQEIDMVINISAMRDGDVEYVERDIKAVVDVAKPYGVSVKAILEVIFLDDEQLKAAAQAAERAGVAFVKTSTGFKPDTVEDIEHKVKVLSSVVKPETIIKASGVCISIDNILRYYKAGARRFGTPCADVILDDYAAL